MLQDGSSRGKNETTPDPKPSHDENESSVWIDHSWNEEPLVPEKDSPKCGSGQRLRADRGTRGHWKRQRWFDSQGKDETAVFLRFTNTYSPGTTDPEDSPSWYLVK